MHPTVAAATKQPCFLQNPEVFRHRRQRHGMRSSEMRDAAGTTRQVRENAPPGGVGQGGESSVQCGGRIFNQMVNYLTAPSRMCKHFFMIQPSVCGQFFKNLVTRM